MITPDDPRLTAYALDELNDAERAEVELARAVSVEPLYENNEAVLALRAEIAAWRER